MMFLNFVTGEMEDIPLKLFINKDQSAYIPQDPVTQDLYKTYISMGISPSEASYEILAAHQQGKFKK